MEAHATRSWVAIILASVVGLSIVMLTAAGIYDTLASPGDTDLSSSYV